VPLGCVVALTVPGTPGPAVGVVPLGTVNAGQIGAHPVPQVLTPLWSVGSV
jgi:hypothetical protein